MYVNVYVNDRKATLNISETGVLSLSHSHEKTLASWFFTSNSARRTISDFRAAADSIA